MLTVQNGASRFLVVEFGVGLNLTIFDEKDFGVPDGVINSELGLAVAAGYTLQVDNMCFPFNVAAVLNDNGTSLAVMAGWNIRF